MHGVKDATTDHDKIARWWSIWPEANIGLATGNRFFVLDVDPRNGGDDTLRKLEMEYADLPATVQARTGGGGDHYYFLLPNATTAVKTIGDGLDIQAAGKYVVAPPSKHASGRQYLWEGASNPTDTPLAPAPSWLIELMSRKKAPNVVPEGDSGVPISTGGRNNALTSMAGTMRRRNMTEGAIMAALQVENQERCQPPLEEEEVMCIAKSICRYPAAADITSECSSSTQETQPADNLERLFASDQELYGFTDLGNARRLVASHGADLRYVYSWEKWAVWNGRQFEIDDCGEAMRRAKSTVDHLIYEEEYAVDAKQKSGVYKHARRSQSYSSSQGDAFVCSE